MIIVAPATAPQVFTPPLRGVQHPLAPAVMTAIRQHGPTPVNLWTIVNTLAKAQMSGDRKHHESWRLRFWGAIRELQRAELLFRHRSWIALKDFVFRPRIKPVESLPPSVGESACQNGRSNTVTANGEPRIEFKHPAANKLEIVNQRSEVAPPESKSARPSMGEISAAASTLAKRPRPQIRKWTGNLHGERIRRRTPVLLPNGDVRPAYVVLRGFVLVIAPEGTGRIYDRYRVSEVQRVKNSAAQLLGSLKRGVIEIKSVAKAAAARRNGCQPPRPGSRPRGRPRRSIVATGTTRG